MDELKLQAEAQKNMELDRAQKICQNSVIVGVAVPEGFEHVIPKHEIKVDTNYQHGKKLIKSTRKECELNAITT